MRKHTPKNEHFEGSIFLGFSGWAFEVGHASGTPKNEDFEQDIRFSAFIIRAL